MPTEFDTREFQDTKGAGFHNAAAAWSATNPGSTGDGVTIAIVDTGIDTANSEFTGRILAASKDMVTRTNVNESGGTHGTTVAMLAAAARDGSGIMGIAYDADILALRVDRDGSCARKCRFDLAPIADAIRYAAASGAKVINLSMGGSSSSAAVNQAIADVLANKDVVIVVAAGNDGKANPTGFVTGILAAGTTRVIVAGSVDANGTLSAFSDRAGTTQNNYLAALGDGQPNPLGSGILQGTSFSAPQISGAIALLAQAFPSMSGAELVERLLESAHDVGAPGVDAIYGWGILDINRAMQPAGQTNLAGTSGIVPLSSVTGAGSEAMGDALTTASLETVILDKYQRAYAMDLGGSMRSASLVPRLRNALSGDQRTLGGASEAASFAFTVNAAGGFAEPIWPEAMRLSQEDARQAQVLAARVALRVSPDTQIGFGFADSANGLVAQMQGAKRPAFFVAQDAGGEEGFHADNRVTLAMRRQLGPWGLTVGAEAGRIVSGAPAYLGLRRDDRTRDGMTRVGVAVDRTWGPVDMAFGVNWLNENRTVLGGRFSDAFGGKGADSVSLDGRLGWDFAPSWRIAGAWRESWTRARTSGLIADGSGLRSRAWSVDLSREQVFGKSDSLALRIAQPMRVEKGQLRLDMPISYDYATETAGFGTRSLNLAPTGREIIGELAWNGRLLTGWASASVFYRRDPGHYAQLPDDKGVALRWTTGF